MTLTRLSAAFDSVIPKDTDSPLHDFGNVRETPITIWQRRGSYAIKRHFFFNARYPTINWRRRPVSWMDFIHAAFKRVCTIIVECARRIAFLRSNPKRVSDAYLIKLVRTFNTTRSTSSDVITSYLWTLYTIYDRPVSLASLGPMLLGHLHEVSSARYHGRRSEEVKYISTTFLPARTPLSRRLLLFTYRSGVRFGSQTLFARIQ